MPGPPAAHARFPSVQKPLAGALPLRARSSKEMRCVPEPWRTVAVAAAVPVRTIRFATFLVTLNRTVVRFAAQR